MKTYLLCVSNVLPTLKLFTFKNYSLNKNMHNAKVSEWFERGRNGLKQAKVMGQSPS